MQSDPIGLEGGENSFVYVDGNPLSQIDRTGQNIGTVIGGEYGSVFGPVGAAIGAAVGTVIVYVAGKAIANEISKEDSEDDKVALYRVVGRAEYIDLMTKGGFRIPDDSVHGGFREKQFWFKVSDADWFANTGFVEDYALVKIFVSKNTIESGFITEDVGHTLVSFHESVLPLLNNDMRNNGGIFTLKFY